MNKTQFTSNIEAKSSFIKWAEQPALFATHGDVEHHTGKAFVETPDGRQVLNVNMLVDKETGETTWQNQDGIDRDSNSDSVKRNALEAYLKSNFDAYFVVDLDLANNWAEANVYELTAGKLNKKTVLVFKKGDNPISHLDVITV